MSESTATPPDGPDKKTAMVPVSDPKSGKMAGRLSADERAFLPAALEIMETPAHPLGRTLSLVIIGIFLIAIGWSVIGKLNVVAVCLGSVVPVEGVKVIQPVEIGIVRSINVNDGQYVQEGELLISLDSTSSEVDTDQVLREQHIAALEIKRLEALLSVYRGHHESFFSPEGFDQHEINEAREQLLSDVNVYLATLDFQNTQLKQKRSLRDATISEIKKLSQILPLYEDYDRIVRPLLEKGYFTKPEWLDLQRQLVEVKMNLKIEGFRLKEAEAGIDSSLKQKEQYVHDAKQGVLSKLRDERNKLDSASITLRKAKQRQLQMALRAPVSGVVQGLTVRTIGGVVTPAETLMQIVPESGSLESKCKVLNKDIGFVHEGDETEVKLEAFPFTKYGVINGRVRHISRDSIPDEKMGLVYEATIDLEKTQILVEDRMVNLSPGMSVTAEIKTGKRRIIEYLMSPLMRYQSEAMRER